MGKADADGIRKRKGGEAKEEDAASPATKPEERPASASAKDSDASDSASEPAAEAPAAASGEFFRKKTGVVLRHADLADRLDRGYPGL